MKRNLLVLAAVVLSVLSLCSFKENNNTKCIHITLVGQVDGRPVYEVVLPNSRKIESMYGEEIGNGLATGDWLYNEDYKITIAN